MMRDRASTQNKSRPNRERLYCGKRSAIGGLFSFLFLTMDRTLFNQKPLVATINRTQGHQFS